MRMIDRTAINYYIKTHKKRRQKTVYIYVIYKYQSKCESAFYFPKLPRIGNVRLDVNFLILCVRAIILLENYII